MPINWLADLQDHIKQLKEIDNFQRDECYNVLNLLGGNPNLSQLSKSGTFSYKEMYGDGDDNENEETSSDDAGISER